MVSTSAPYMISLGMSFKHAIILKITPNYMIRIDKKSILKKETNKIMHFIKKN